MSDILYEHLDDGQLLKKCTDLQAFNEHLEKKCLKLEGDICLLMTELTKMKTTENNLTQNLSVLLATAQTEITRKDKQIAELRSQLDNIVFRRNRSNFNKNETTKQDNINVKSVCDSNLQERSPIHKAKQTHITNLQDLASQECSSKRRRSRTPDRNTTKRLRHQTTAEEKSASSGYSSRDKHISSDRGRNARRSPVRFSPKRDRPVRRSPDRFSPKRDRPARRSPVRFSPKRGRHGRRSPELKSRRDIVPEKTAVDGRLKDTSRHNNVSERDRRKRNSRERFSAERRQNYASSERGSIIRNSPERFSAERSRMKRNSQENVSAERGGILGSRERFSAERGRKMRKSPDSGEKSFIPESMDEKKPTILNYEYNALTQSQSADYTNYKNSVVENLDSNETIVNPSFFIDSRGHENNIGEAQSYDHISHENNANPSIHSNVSLNFKSNIDTKNNILFNEQSTDATVFDTIKSEIEIDSNDLRNRISKNRTPIKNDLREKIPKVEKDQFISSVHVEIDNVPISNHRRRRCTVMLID